MEIFKKRWKYRNLKNLFKIIKVYPFSKFLIVYPKKIKYKCNKEIV